MLPCRLYAAPWLTRCLGAAALMRALPLLLVALAAAALWAVHASAPAGEPRQWGVLFNSVAGVAAGCAALAWVRPQRAGLSPPHVMLSLGFGGMLIGLLFDVAQTGPAGRPVQPEQCAGSAAKPAAAFDVFSLDAPGHGGRRLAGHSQPAHLSPPLRSIPVLAVPAERALLQLDAAGCCWV